VLASLCNLPCINFGLKTTYVYISIYFYKYFVVLIVQDISLVNRVFIVFRMTQLNFDYADY